MNEISNPGAVAFIGCGNIAHVHMRFLQKAGYKVDAVCDASQIRSDLFAKQYGIDKQFTNVDDLFAVANPWIVHILTPPHTHHQLIIMALKAGCNVLVEKPLCQSLSEYQEISSLAEKLGLLVSVDHTRVYNPMISAARSRIKSGEFGKIIRMEYAYDDPSIVKSQNDRDCYRWAKGTPAWFAKVRGGVLTDLLPHPLSVFLSFDEELKTKHIETRTLSGGVIEELSVFMQSNDINAQISLSVNQRPLKNIFTVYCEKGSVQVDLRGMYSVYQPDRKLPGIVSRAVVALSTAWQIASGFSVNVIKLLTGKAHTYDGLGEIITSFYGMVRADKTGEVPLINAGRVMGLVEGILSTTLETEDKIAVQTTPIAPTAVKVPAGCLVLGGTGFIGKYVVNRLVDSGKAVRVLCRQSSNYKSLPQSVDIAYGDMKDKISISSALSGTKTIIHCAAAMSGDWAEFYESTVQGTKNLLSILEKSQVERFVYISSLGVLDYNKLSNGNKVDESSPMEAKPADRGFYTRAKVEAEQLVQEFSAKNNQITTVILRPGLVYGQESNNNLQNCGILLDKIVFVFGCGQRQLGLNYVENLADAVVSAATVNLPNGSLFQIIDQEQPSVKMIINENNRLSNTKVVPVYVPIFIWKMLFRAADLLFYLKSRKLGTFSYRFASNSKKLDYRFDKFMAAINSGPRYGFKSAFKKTYIMDSNE